MYKSGLRWRIQTCPFTTYQQLPATCLYVFVDIHIPPGTTLIGGTSLQDVEYSTSFCPGNLRAFKLLPIEPFDFRLWQMRDNCQTDSLTMSTTTNAVVEALPTTRSFLPPRPLPSTSGVELNEHSENLEMKDRTLTTNTGVAAPSIALLSNTHAYRVRARIQFASLCYSLFLAGWNDGTTGPLLPRIREVYHVRPPTLCHLS